VKTAVLLLLFLGQAFHEPPDVPTSPTANPGYPLHLRVLNVHWNHTERYGYQGYGRADLLGPQPQGVDYTFECNQPFLHNAQPGEFYLGRWKKQGQSIELLTQKVGSNKTDKCEVKVALKDAPYGKYGPPAAPASQSAPAPAPQN
jgi:hypothetical protein